MLAGLRWKGSQRPTGPYNRFVSTKYLLDESQIPTSWLNLLPDLPGEPLPPLNPGTGEPAGPEDLARSSRWG